MSSQPERAGTEKVPAWDGTMLEVACQLFESRAKFVRAMSPDVRQYEFQQAEGEGDTPLLAIDDWYCHLPAGPFASIFWRWRPTIDRDDDYDTKKTRYRVYARFAIIPE